MRPMRCTNRRPLGKRLLTRINTWGAEPVHQRLSMTIIAPLTSNAKLI